MKLERLLPRAVASLLAVTALAHAAPRPQDEVPDAKPQAAQRWFADYDEALAVAKTEGKDLLVDFTGSDWCGWCIRLHDEVFKHDAFYAPVTERFVLVALDFPNGEEAKAKVPNPERNDELAAQHEIGGFPTILLVGVDGESFGRTGYREGGAEPYVSHLMALTRSGKALLAAGKALPARYDTAEDKAAVVREAIALLEGAVEGAGGVDAVATFVRRGYELDPENASGLKLAALQAVMKGGAAEESDLALAEEMDATNEHGLLELAVAARRFGVQDDASANAYVDRLLAFARLGKVHDKEALKDAVHGATFWAHSYLDRPEDAQTLLAFAETLGEVPEELRAALKG